MRIPRCTIAIAATAVLCAGVALAQDSTVDRKKGVDSSKPEAARDRTSAPQTTRDAPATVPETARDDQTSAPQTARDAPASGPETARDDQTSAPQTARDPPASGPETARDDQTSTPQTAASDDSDTPEAASPTPHHRRAATAAPSTSPKHL
jgi:hypothetical protein